MTLPRFTSGQVGRLDFSHLNDAFGYIDEMRGISPPASGAPRDPGFFVARIGSTGAALGVPDEAGNNVQYYGHWWKESTWSGSFIDLPNGRAAGDLTATDPLDKIKFPALSLNGKVLDEGSFAILFPQVSNAYGMYKARAFYVAVSIPEGMQPLRIDSSTAMSGTSGRWKYRVTKMKLNLFTNAYEEVAGSTQFDAYNTVETLVDNNPEFTFGVGSVRPTGATVTRRAIKNGAIVLGTQFGIYWQFTVPNGYQVTCT